LANITRLDSGAWQVSLPFLGEPQIIGSYLLSGENELAIIDPGPGSTLESLLAALREAGFDPQDVTHLLLTHIHLDHAGATGSLTRLLPRAQVYVHGLGAPHLIDPSRVMASAARIYGDRMKLLWGDIEATPPDRVQCISDGDTLNVAGRQLAIYYTPGHAIHHVSFFDTRTREFFAGDVAGVRLPDVDYVRPPTPPPDIDLETWSQSIARIRQLRPDILYLAHFGPTSDVARHLDRLEAALYRWGDFVLEAMRQGKNEAEIITLLIEKTQPDLERVAQDAHTVQRYEIAANYAMSAQGLIRYWKRLHPERL
jgi:glyoxylase-like metal-dependent hydrolase (beta-lactamase superfamily II)